MYGKNGVIYSEGIGVCRIILSAMSKKRQQKNVICRYQLFDIEQ